MKDLLTDSSGDVMIKDNDLVIGFSDFQHQEHLLVAQKGDLKESPTVGVGIENFINDSEVDGLLAEIKSEFTKDGMLVKKIGFDEQTGNLSYEANY